MMYAKNALLKQGQVSGVHSYTVVLFAPALLHVVPPPLLLQQIQTCTQRPNVNIKIRMRIRPRSCHLTWRPNCACNPTSFLAPANPDLQTDTERGEK